MSDDPPSHDRPSWLACLTVEHRPQWRVTQRKCNHSTFNGGRRTISAYSEVRCPACPRRWRTKAAYVDALPDDGPTANPAPTGSRLADGP